MSTCETGAEKFPCVLDIMFWNCFGFCGVVFPSWLCAVVFFCKLFCFWFYNLHLQVTCLSKPRVPFAVWECCSTGLYAVHCAVIAGRFAPRWGLAEQGCFGSLPNHDKLRLGFEMCDSNFASICFFFVSFSCMIVVWHLLWAHLHHSSVACLCVAASVANAAKKADKDALFVDPVEKCKVPCQANHTTNQYDHFTIHFFPFHFISSTSSVNDGTLPHRSKTAVPTPAAGVKNPPLISRILGLRLCSARHKPCSTRILAVLK